MKFRNFGSLSIAIVGTGDAASVYAASFAIAGHDVFLARKDSDHTVMSPILGSLANVNFCSIERASAEADVIILAAPPADVREIAYWMGDVRGKVVIDLTSAASTSHDVAINTLGAIKAITGSQNVVKVFCTRGYQRLLRPILQSEELHMLMVGDCQKAKELVRILARDLGVTDFMDMGGSEAIPLLDAMASCWYDLRNNMISQAMQASGTVTAKDRGSRAAL